MLVKDVRSAKYTRVGDGSMLSELLHPDRGEGVALDCSIAHAIVPPGEATLPHRLRTSTEVYFIISGEGRMSINGEVRKVRAGEAIYIPAGARQSIENTGREDLAFLCIVDPRWRKEDEEILVRK